MQLLKNPHNLFPPLQNLVSTFTATVEDIVLNFFHDEVAVGFGGVG